MKSGVNENLSFDDEFVDEFIYLSEKIQNLAAQFKVNIKPYKSKTLPLFSMLFSSKKQEVLSQLKCYLEICSEAINNGYQLTDTPNLVWYALKKLGYRPTSDLFLVLKKEHVVEIHTSEFIQVFRSLNFYEYCSYSLEELHCLPVDELFRRDEKSWGRIVEYLSRLYSGEIKTAQEYLGDIHYLEEIQSQEKLKVKDYIVSVAPLYPLNTVGSRPTGTITIERPEFNAELELSNHL